MGRGGDHDLADQWVTTWTYARGLDVTLVDGWPLVQVRSRTRETELICVEPGPEEFERLLGHVEGRPGAMLTVVADDVGPYAAIALPPGIRVDRDDESLMATTLDPVEVPSLPGELTSRWETIGHQTRYAVESGDRVAAEALLGVRGEWATFDAVETTPMFRRRGLGRHVMAALTAHAVQRGATHGVLAATAEGRQLYASLGWEHAYEMRSLMGTVEA
jgi:GNAT superfamily N-acetyltransferase